MAPKSKGGDADTKAKEELVAVLLADSFAQVSEDCVRACVCVCVCVDGRNSTRRGARRPSQSARRAATHRRQPPLANAPTATLPPPLPHNERATETSTSNSLTILFNHHTDIRPRHPGTPQSPPPPRQRPPPRPRPRMARLGGSGRSRRLLLRPRGRGERPPGCRGVGRPREAAPGHALRVHGGGVGGGRAASAGAGW